MDKLRILLLWLRNILFDWYYWPRSRREFLTRLADIHAPADAVDVTWDYKGGGFYRYMKPNQDRSELKRLAERVAALAPHVIVEIGTRDGGTLLPWSQVSDSLELLVSLDLPGGIHGGGYTVQRAKLYRLFTSNRPACQLELLRVDSQSEASKAKLVEMLNGRAIDFLFIDGDHRYPGVKKDYALYEPLVRPGGLIAFHDIRPVDRDSTIEVFKLWEEIKQAAPSTEEIINEPYRGRYGIGLIVKSG